ncbi:MAG: hypothetical protein OXI35_18705 [Gemmatimonadota bacterium]|nr:hypothetical protein [Gemmatimonadota bacterium]
MFNKKWKAAAAKLAYTTKEGSTIHPANAAQLTKAIGIYKCDLDAERKKVEDRDAELRAWEAREAAISAAEKANEKRTGELDAERDSLGEWEDKLEKFRSDAELAPALRESNHLRWLLIKEFLGYIEQGKALGKRAEDAGFKMPDRWDEEGSGEGEIVAALGFGKRVIEAQPPLGSGPGERPTNTQDDAPTVS